MGAELFESPLVSGRLEGDFFLYCVSILLLLRCQKTRNDTADISHCGLVLPSQEWILCAHGIKRAPVQELGMRRRPDLLATQRILALPVFRRSFHDGVYSQTVPRKYDRPMCVADDSK